jgi:hypothetical protein
MRQGSSATADTLQIVTLGIRQSKERVLGASRSHPTDMADRDDGPGGQVGLAWRLETGQARNSTGDSLSDTEIRYCLVTMVGSLCVNTSHVVHETIDGETILIHLGTGTYYSLDGAGSELWVILAAGASRESVFAAASDRYTGDPGEVEAGLSSLLEHLLQEGLLVEGEAGVATGSLHLPPGQIPFVAPVLHVYNDMQEFMLVDPLHDVDEVAGWPHAKTD